MSTAHTIVADVIWEAPRARPLWEKMCQWAGMVSAVQRTLNEQGKKEHGEEDSGRVSMEEAVKDLCHSDCLWCLRPWIQKNNLSKEVE